MKELVSVVMSVYNTPEAYLRESIESISNQTWRDLEFIVVNDGSNADTSSILRDYAARDSRIRLIENTENRGLTKNLNSAIRQATGRYIARMDSDDISMPTRLERQVEFLERNDDVSVLGTEWLLLKDGQLTAPRRYENQPWQIQGRLLYGCQGILHPSVMFRREIFTRDGFYYDEDFRIAQDFELWTRIGLRRKIYVLPEELMKYRISDVQISTAKTDRQIAFRTKVLLKALEALGVTPTEEEKTLHVQFSHGKAARFVAEINAWAERLRAANRERALYDPVAFEYYTSKRQLDAAVHTLTRRGPTPGNFFGTLRAAWMARRAKKAFHQESALRGDLYAQR